MITHDQIEAVIERARNRLAQATGTIGLAVVGADDLRLILEAARSTLWQDIKDAPRDGTPFRTWVVRSDMPDRKGWLVDLCRFNEHGAFETYGRVDYDQDGWEAPYAAIQPILFQPLPKGPDQ